MTIFIAIKRFLIILIAYGLSTLMAGFGIALIATIADPDKNPLFPFVAFGGFASIVIAVFSSIPSALLVLLAEWRSWRSVWLYCGFAVCAGVVLGLIISITKWFPLAGAVLGIMSGGLFWAVAGRNAGSLASTNTPNAQWHLLLLLGTTALLLGVGFYFPGSVHAVNYVAEPPTTPQ